MWDAASGARIGVLIGHGDTVWSALFSPDGRRIVTASADRTARVWDVSRTAAIMPERATVLAAALVRGIGWRTDSERVDLLMQDAEDDLHAEALKQLGRTANDPEIAEVVAALAEPLHENCYLSPTQFAEKFGLPIPGKAAQEPATDAGDAGSKQASQRKRHFILFALAAILLIAGAVIGEILHQAFGLLSR
jgi:hypothetical protein